MRKTWAPTGTKALYCSTRLSNPLSSIELTFVDRIYTKKQKIKYVLTTTKKNFSLSSKLKKLATGFTNF